MTNYYPNKELKSFIRSDLDIEESIEIQKNKVIISFNNISLKESFNIPSSNFKVNYHFHWSNRFLNNIFNS